jgi:uracil-DNA glycosylase family 4
MSALTELYDKIAVCSDCALSHSRNRAVPGEGPEDAEIMFVGEAPGFYEDQQGLPFVGPAGRLLDDLLGSIGFRRDQVYIANVIKCRPPDNRDPLPKEIEACRKVVVPLGRFSLAWFFPNESIGRMHGHARYRDGIYYLPMYHPAAALHAANMRRAIEEDFQKLPAVLEEARKGPKEEVPEPQQMRLF